MSAARSQAYIRGAAEVRAAGAAGRARARRASDGARLRLSQVKRARQCSVAFPNAAQLGASAYCISGTSREKIKKKNKKIREIHNFVKVVDHNLPLPSFKSITGTR